MALYFIGLGLNDEKDITVKGLETVKRCEHVYLETYTSILQVPISRLEEFYGKDIIQADRELVEQRSYEMLDCAKDHDVAFLVIGDIFGATTHTDLMLRAKEQGVECHFIHNASILNAIGIVGLELYKYGKVTSMPFATKSFNPETPYDVIKNNLKNDMHSLLLLDLNPKEEKYVTVNEAINRLLDIGKGKGDNTFTQDTFCIGCARIGGNYTIKAGLAKHLQKHDFGPAPHCLIVPGKLHFIEEEAIKQWE